MGEEEKEGLFDFQNRFPKMFFGGMGIGGRFCVSWDLYVRGVGKLMASR